MDYIGLSANEESVKDARAKLKAYKDTSLSDRANAAKSFDEHAAEIKIPGNLQGGVVTLTQAEAKFIDLNVRAYSDMSDFFTQVIPLEFGQQPIFKTRYDHAIRVNRGHLAGAPPSVKWQTTQAGIPVTPFQYFSEEVLVPNLVNTSYDLAKFQEKERALERLAYEMKLKKQQYRLATMLLQSNDTPIATAIAAYYALTTPFQNRVPYVLDAQVDQNSIATTNTIDSHLEGGLTKNFFKAIASQMILQRHQARAMFIPISGKPWEAHWNEASVVATVTNNGNMNPVNAIPPSKWEEAVTMGFTENGQNMNWFGLNLWVQPVNILPASYALIATNEAPVLEWDQYEASVSGEDPLSGKDRGLAKRYEARSIALASPDPGALAFAVAKYA